VKGMSFESRLHTPEIGIFDNNRTNAGNSPECIRVYEARSAYGKRTSKEHDRTQLLKLKKKSVNVTKFLCKERLKGTRAGE
jgi:hypothetical protein